MKKFLYVAVMALTMGFFASCSGSSSAYTKGGPEPTIDTEAGTVNGKVYDNQTAKCWKITESYTYMGFRASEDVWMWGTEFLVVSTCEETMWSMAQLGYGSASYSYVVTTDADYNACNAHNSEE